MRRKDLSPMSIRTTADPLSAIEEKVGAGERLSADDGLALLESPHLLRLGRMADRARRSRGGDEVYFINNRHINHTNVCKNRCDFCAFSRDEGEDGRLHHGARRGAGPCPGGPGPRRDRTAHRGGRAPDAGLRGHPRHDRRHPPRLPRTAHHRLHGQRDRALRGRERHDRRRGAARPAVGRPEHAPRRGSRDPVEAGARPGVRPQDLGREVGRGAPAGPSAGHPHECHHAVRASRDPGRACRSPDPPAHGAGRDGRLPGLHPSRLPPQEHQAGRPRPDHRASRTWP